MRIVSEVKKLHLFLKALDQGSVNKMDSALDSLDKNSEEVVKGDRLLFQHYHNYNSLLDGLTGEINLGN